MEPGDDQQPVERAIEEEAEPAAFDDDAASAVDCAADMGIAISHDHSVQQSGESAGDRHEAPSAEESQLFRKRDGREAVVEVPDDQAREYADRKLQTDEQADRALLQTGRQHA